MVALDPHNAMVLDHLRADLLFMAESDRRTREELASDGSLFEGYHPRLREVHERNAAKLSAILEDHGWPGRSLVGGDAAEAAWLILQHAIGNPSLQRRGLTLLREAALVGEASMLHVAMLDDRIRSFEGKGQLYGTQFDWDGDGLMSPLPIEDKENVDGRRREVGLAPMTEEIERRRKSVARERPPKDWKARQREKERWLRSNGWRS
jgi:hypothetical protein